MSSKDSNYKVESCHKLILNISKLLQKNQEKNHSSFCKDIVTKMVPIQRTIVCSSNYILYIAISLFHQLVFSKNLCFLLLRIIFSLKIDGTAIMCRNGINRITDIGMLFSDGNKSPGLGVRTSPSHRVELDKK